MMIKSKGLFGDRIELQWKEKVMEWIITFHILFGWLEGME